MSRRALDREHRQDESPAISAQMRWGPVHVYRTSPGSVIAELLAGGVASALRRVGPLLALLAAAGAMIAIVASALAPSAPRTHRYTGQQVRVAPERGANAARTVPSSRPAPSLTPKSHNRVTAPQASPAAATQLEARGHELLRAGRYEAAVPLLQRAVAATGVPNGACLEPTSQNCLTYAFALYDLGQALRLSGRPTAAVPILERRMRIDNQREAVAAELLLALRGRSG